MKGEKLLNHNNEQQGSTSTLGNMYQPFGEHLENPYGFFELARKQQPIFFSPALSGWVVTDYSDILSIVNQPERFSSRDTLRPLVSLTPAVFAELGKGYPQVPMHINGDGKNHQRFRTPLVSALSAAQVKQMEPLVTTIATRLIDSFVNDQQAEMISQFAYPFPLEVILTLLGVRKEDMTHAKQWSDDWLALVSSQLSEERQIECARGLVALQHYFAQLIEDRKQKPQDDLITAMITTTVSGEEPLNETELVNALGGLLVAGHETTTNLIGNGLALLLDPATRSERWEQIRAHPDLIPVAIEEILRYDDPAQAFFRTTTQGVTIGGQTMPEGTLLLLVYGSANRDEDQFPDPTSFQLQRTPNRHLAFGYGVHFCVGAALARLEGRIAFEILARRLPHLRLVPEQSPAHVPTLMFRGYRSLAMEWDAS